MHLIALALSGASLAMLYEIYIGKVKIQMWHKVYQVCNNIDDLNVVKNKKSKFSDGEILAKIKNKDIFIVNVITMRENWENATN